MTHQRAAQRRARSARISIAWTTSRCEALTRQSVEHIVNASSSWRFSSKFTIWCTVRNWL
jgi:hypothetical protein